MFVIVHGQIMGLGKLTISIYKIDSGVGMGRDKDTWTSLRRLLGLVIYPIWDWGGE